MELETAPKRSRTRSSAARHLLLGAILLGSLALACRNPRRPPAAPVEATSSRVDVFVRCADPSSQTLRFALSGAELRDESGALRALDVARGTLRSSDLDRRTTLAGAIVPPARYLALVLHVAGAWLERPEGAVELDLAGGQAAQDEPAPVEPARSASFEVPIDLRLRAHDAASVFLEWRAADSLSGGLGFRPALAASLETPQTALGLLYVCDAERGSVLSIDRATGEIVGTFKVGAGPDALTLLRDRRRMFVANGGDGSLSVLDVRLGRVISNLPIAFGARTADVVVADPTRWIAAANPGLDSVAFVTLGADGGIQTVSVGRNPVRLAAAPSLGRLYVLENGGDSLSVIDTNTRAVAASVALESRPTDLDLDRDERELYVGHETSPNLLVLDARTLAQQAKIFCGGAVTDVLADARRSRIYVARARPTEIVVIERRVSSIVLRIPVSGRIASMTLARDGSKLYAAAPELGSVLVIDVVTGREEWAIGCGGKPMDVVVAE